MELTYETFKTYGGDDDKITETDFNKFLPVAELSLSVATLAFYETHSLQDDYDSVRYKLRALRYLQALSAQINFIGETGTSNAQRSNRPTSQRIGDTSLSYGKDTNGTENLSVESQNLLSGVGLLYRGACL